jgi:FkbM family methyltransferase
MRVRLIDCRRFYVWGAGNVGTRVARSLKARGLEVIGFLDSSPDRWGQRLPEGEIFAPAAGLDTADDVACIVAIWRYQHSFPETAGRAEALGIKTVVHFSRAVEAFGLEGVLPNYCVDHPEATFGAAGRDALPYVRSRLADERSRGVFDQTLMFRRNPAPANVPAPDTDWPFDPGAVRGLIDIGACIGEFCDTALQTFPNLARIRAYEPDPHNFARLMAGSAAASPRIAFEGRNAALSDQTGQVRFAAEGGWGSHIVEDGGIEVQAVRLDDDLPALSGDGLTLLKMDVEGNEMRALAGMAHLLADPRLIASITIEHRAQDLYEIGALLARRSGCRLYLRAFDSEVGMDCCFVSVPAGPG